MSNLSEWIKTCDELEERCNQLKAENASLRASSFVTAVPVEHYERVVKAGDEMARHYLDASKIEWGKNTTYTPPSIVRWTAAKEGKPSV
jgi:hypothetical protein